MKKLLSLLVGVAMCIFAAGTAFADVTPPVMPSTDYMIFMPLPDANEPLTLVKDATTDVKIYPRDQKDEVYYRILSVDGADLTSPITTADIKVEVKSWGNVTNYEPIHVDESMINANGQFAVKAAVRKPDGSFVGETTAAYNMEIVFPNFATKLVFTPPTEVMVGGQYEMPVTFTTPADTLAKYGNQTWDFILTWDGNLFDKIEYRFSAEEAYTSVSLDDIVQIERQFKLLMEQGIQLRFTMARKRQAGMNEAAVAMGIGRGAFMAATYLASGEFKCPFLDRPAADPAFSPQAGYIEKGKTVTISCSTKETDIYYTTDGTYPTLSPNTLYTAPVAITKGTTIKAVAHVKNGQPSDTSFVSEAVYSVVGIPQVTPASGRVVIDSLVEITLGDGRGNTLANNGTTAIYYTLDGSEPSATNGTKYTAPFRLRPQDANLKVVAVLDEDKSPVVTREYTLVPAAPVASSPSGSTVEYGTFVTLSCATQNAAIYYKLGGSGDASSADIRYTEPIEITKSINLKAVAYYGNNPSQRVNFTYTVALASPKFSLPEGRVPFGSRVTLDSRSIAATQGTSFPASIVYTTDGTEPVKANINTLPVYSMPIEITDDVTIKAITRCQSVSGWQLSSVVTATYTVNRPATPEFSLPAGTVEEGTELAITCKTEGVTIYYTLDGSEPTTQSAEYKEPIVITEDVTVKAIAISGNEEDGPSRVAEAAYVCVPWDRTVATPEFNRAAGEVEKGTEISIGCVTNKAVIYYTLDGSEPTAASTPYEKAIIVDSTVTVKAIAIREDVVSEVATVTYTVKSEGTANEGLELSGVSVFPNPSEGLFNIELPVAATIEVFTANGVLTQRVNAAAGVATLNINRSGIYFLRITGEGRTAVKRVVVR